MSFYLLRSLQPHSPPPTCSRSPTPSCTPHSCAPSAQNNHSCSLSTHICSQLLSTDLPSGTSPCHSSLSSSPAWKLPQWLSTSHDQVHLVRLSSRDSPVPLASDHQHSMLSFHIRVFLDFLLLPEPS